MATVEAAHHPAEAAVGPFELEDLDPTPPQRIALQMIGTSSLGGLFRGHYALDGPASQPASSAGNSDNVAAVG